MLPCTDPIRVLKKTWMALGRKLYLHLRGEGKGSVNHSEVWKRQKGWKAKR